MSSKKNKKKANNASARLRKYGVPNRTNVTILLILLLAVLLTTVNVAKNVQAKNEKKQFTWANAKISDVQMQIETIVPLAKEMKRSEGCYYDEKNGDFDRGTLHCELTLKGSYAVEDYQSFSTTKSLLSAIVYSKDNFGMGVQSLTDTSDGFYFSKQNMTCGIDNDSINPANFDSSKDATGKVTFDFSIYCDQRSHREYYPIE